MSNRYGRSFASSSPRAIWSPARATRSKSETSAAVVSASFMDIGLPLGHGGSHKPDQKPSAKYRGDECESQAQFAAGFPSVRESAEEIHLSSRAVQPDFASAFAVCRVKEGNARNLAVAKTSTDRQGQFPRS